MKPALASSSKPSSPGGAATSVAAEPGTMKAILAERYGQPDVLELRDVEMPAIEDDQVLVRVHASSVNPVEWYGVMGPWFVRLFGGGLRAPKDPQVGGDLAGRVEAVGKDVKELQPGDEVFGSSGDRSWAQYAPAREARLARKPAGVSFEDAAAVPVAGLTALQALRDHGRVQSGQKVLINGASGGVGTYAVQLAKYFGATVTGVCSTRNVDQARSLGADQVIDYTQEDFTQRAERFDLVLDIAGSRRFSELRRVLTRDATIVVIGAKMTNRGLGPLGHLIGMMLAGLGRSQTVRTFIAKIRTEDLEFMGRLLEDGAVKSVIDRRFDLSQAADALRYLGEGHSRGKNVITV